MTGNGVEPLEAIMLLGGALVVLSQLARLAVWARRFKKRPQDGILRYTIEVSPAAHAVAVTDVTFQAIGIGEPHEHEHA